MKVMKFTLAIHGGAGTRRREAMSPEAEAGYRTGLQHALMSGYRVLKEGGPALEAVTKAVMALEDDPQFNAGRGAVYTSAGTHEMDAAVMEGASRKAGAVAGVMGPRNPVLAARAVMERSENVLLIGEGAMQFCREQGLAFKKAPYFATTERFEALQAELERRRVKGMDMRDDAAKHGTVGAVACDAGGNLAAATSTGGMTGKTPGRVGDCPVFGAGTWADESCAISATGHGEVFIRYAAAHEIASRMRLGKQSLAAAAEAVVAELGALGGSGGLIGVDATGEVALPFNCTGMYRGRIGADGIAWTGIYREPLKAKELSAA
ncbi:MAG: isoaspartyl peptidase/L-asparaginase [Hyphomicrobiales bacterium]|nr:isoaspartyl peptidase/L-asparaginase [Hyphomicrobiales bacterium]